MRFATSLILALFLIAMPVHAGEMRENLLRSLAVKAGLVPPADLLPEIDPLKSAAGRLLFASKELSMSRETSCQMCHLDRFSSTDGIPNAIGTRGIGEGMERALTGGDILPRNALPLWGRGAKGFEVFFWDGRVDASSGKVLSQFGDQAPSVDPLVVAAHLPPAEIREMVPDIVEVDALAGESVESARPVYALIEKRVQADPQLSAAVTKAFGVSPDGIRMVHVAESIATFFRDRFRIRSTPLHEFVFGNGRLSDEETAGGLIFYGKGRCASCHGGPFFTDFKFHAIPFGQAGFGKNGFGIDYGRFNVTMDPRDRYKFRTPPLYNVAKTAPYSHSGSTYDLADTIRAHVDPLSIFNLETMTAVQRVEFYKRLKFWSQEPTYEVHLDDQEISDLVAYLNALSFDDPEALDQ